MARKILDTWALAQKVYLDADEEAVRDLALGLLKVVRQRPGGRQRGTSTIPDSDVNELVCLMLDRCRSNSIIPPENLTALVRVQLRRDRPLAIGKGYLFKKQHVLAFKKDNPEASLRQIARAIKVNHTTVMRWLNAASISTSPP